MILSLLSIAAAHLSFFMLYISGSSSFPKPFTAAQEREHLLRCRDGDLDARNMLIERNLRLVAHIIKNR